MDKKKSIATVTWMSYRNSGTYLQAYALQQTLISLGFDSRIIDDSRIISSYPKKRFSPIRCLRSISPSMIKFKRAFRKAEEEFLEFRNTHLLLDSDWVFPNDLSQRYDAYIAGSDQIWSPAVKFDGFYYLDFTSRKKIAYAPSFGVSEYPEARKASVAPLLSEFSSISVREKAGAEILKSEFGIDAEVVVDPTMLMTREQWENCLTLSSCNTADKPYLLCYLLTYNKQYIDFVKEYCNDKGLSLKLIVHSHLMTGITEDEIYVGPIGFLEAIRGAEIIMTDSFHGTIFSMIFQKEFYSFKRFNDNLSYSQNSRLENLLSQVGLEDRYLSADYLQLSHRPIDFLSVESTISKMRVKSLNYLTTALNKESKEQRIAYSAYAKESDLRTTAASGGAASVLSRAFLQKGGIVYGCGQESDARIRYMRIDKEDELWRLADSKYVFIQTSEVFSRVKDDLADGHDVLFIGLPCQVAGVNSAFKEFSENLYTIDMCCHGAPSQSILKAHLDTLGLASSADKVSFRRKGNDGVKYVFSVQDKSGKLIYDRPACRDWYMTGFLSGLFFRQSCFKCPYACPERCSDITLADHWAMGKSPDPEMSVTKGLSTILVNTDKGRSLFNSASVYLKYEQRPLSEAFRNGQFIKPSDKPEDYDSFMACFKERGYKDACRKYLPVYMFRMRVHELKSRYYKSPIRQFIRKLFLK